jgi:hypothetical protein
LLRLCGGGFESQHGNTALICTALQDQLDCARLLIDAGADKEARNDVRIDRCFTGRYLVFYFHFPISLFFFTVLAVFFEVIHGLILYAFALSYCTFSPCCYTFSVTF